ncbi:FtsW/RodA/SpoVE family cell cycle protein [Flavobacterium procerum]|uniref:FtsW/RodA/SpoVE family cell cycle protein n=1 Tax=Flavobacterium procerum TaxID=1455569 RepID=A0ABV6BPV0_9FLAO
MRKKAFLYLVITLISILLLCYFCFQYSNQKGYDTSQQGFSETKGKFIPEQHTDYIFTTVESEFSFSGICFIVAVMLLIVVIVWKKIIKRASKS